VGAPALPSLSKEKIMQQNFPFESEPKETEKSSSHWSSVAEKLERYGSRALNSTEHLGLLVGNQTIAIELLLKPYLPKATTQTLIAALSVSSRATVEEAENEVILNSVVGVSEKSVELEPL
jgi:hypothetical protein